MTRLDGRVALVTGSSRGIGAAVAVHGRETAAVAAVEAEIAGTGGRAMAVVGDVTRGNDVEAMRECIEATLGPIDVLVANAGGNPTPPAAKANIQVLTRTLALQAR